MKNYFVLDTNIFLHYKFFTEIEWLKILDKSAAILLLFPTVLKELDEKKYTGKDDKIRSRAKKVIERLAEILESGNNRLNNNIEIQFIDREPNIDWDSEGLSSGSNDDRIIASMLNFKSNNPDDSLILVTADLGNIVKCKARYIDVIKLDERYLLPKLDEEKKELIELRKQLDKIKASLPNLKIIFKDNQKDHINFLAKKIPPLTEDQIERKLSELAIDLKYIPKNITKDTTHMTMGDILQLGIPADGEVERYEHDLETYIQDYKNYLYKLHSYTQSLELTYELKLILVNEGNAVAKDIDIYMHFPDGFELFEEDNLPEPPKEPKKPIKPQTILEKGRANISIPNLSSLNIPDLSNIRHGYKGPTIKKTNSYEVHFKYDDLKHNMLVNLDSLYIVFQRMENVKSFKIDYRILVSNNPDPLEGKLHVILDN